MLIATNMVANCPPAQAAAIGGRCDPVAFGGAGGRHENDVTSYNITIIMPTNGAILTAVLIAHFGAFQAKP